MTASTHLVTGAFGYTGRYIAARLLEAGHEVRTLTNSPDRAHPFGDRVRAWPLAFDDPTALAEALNGVRVLYNTYWVRFSRAGFSQDAASRNTERLFEAARAAGVERVVHVSITNPSPDSPFQYFRGKARLERALAASGLPHSILRPAVIFGREDILVNNIAWLLRRFPVFAVFGRGQYRLQPILVEDFADLAVREGAASGTRTIDATGPETFTYVELVRTIGAAIGKSRMLLRVPRTVGLFCARLVGLCVRDELLIPEEIDALMAGLLATDAPPAGTTRLSAWTRAHAGDLGHRYASELARRRDRRSAYG